VYGGTGRRTFLARSLRAGLGAGALAMWPGSAWPVRASESDSRPDEAATGAAPQSRPARTFKLHYAPHFGMFRQHAGEDPIAQLEFMAAEGFTALEDNGMRGRPVELQTRIGETLGRLHMRMGVFVAHTIDWNAPTLTSPDEAKREAFLKEVRESVEIAKRVNATWMTVVPGHVDRRPHMDYQTARVVETLKQAAGILEPHGLVMVLEPLNTLRNHPGMFLTTTPQAYLVCKAVASPSCKILYDIYHQQITEGNLIPNIDAAWDEIAYFQAGDNPGRNEPGTGEINYRNVFRHIHRKGFTGVVGMEHGNATRGREGERAVIDAYVAADGWTG
jgi:hydroxypyruvate isomerase